MKVVVHIEGKEVLELFYTGGKAIIVLCFPAYVTFLWAATTAYIKETLEYFGPKETNLVISIVFWHIAT